jgi:hypothetical protein
MAETTHQLIIGEEKPVLGLFRARPTPQPGVAIVLFREGQPLVTLWPEDRLTSGEVTWGNYKVLYRVDITEHSFNFDCDIPCKGEAFDFRAKVQINYSVDKPNIIVAKKIINARQILEPLITNMMRSISRRYDVEQSAQAEEAIIKQLPIDIQQRDTGFKLSHFIVELSLEEEARKHIRKIKQIDRDKEHQKQQAELDRQRLQLEMEHTKLRMDFYSPFIQGGQWQLLALQLANHPEDVATVTQMLSKQRQVELDNQLRTLKVMLEEDVIEGYQMEEACRSVLRRIVDNFETGMKSIENSEPSKQQKAIQSKQESEDVSTEAYSSKEE